MLIVLFQGIKKLLFNLAKKFYKEFSEGIKMKRTESDVTMEVYRFEKRNGRQLRINLVHYKGYNRVDFRDYFEKDGKWLPLPKGVSLGFEDFINFYRGINFRDIIKSIRIFKKNFRKGRPA